MNSKNNPELELKEAIQNIYGKDIDVHLSKSNQKLLEMNEDDKNLQQEIIELFQIGMVKLRD